MKQIKVILIVLGVLLTGFGAGFFTHRAMVGQHMERVRALGRGPGFGPHLLDQIKATPEQQELLMPILANYGDRMEILTRESRQQRRLLMDSLVTDIAPLIEEAQMEQLQETMARFRAKVRSKMPKNRKKRTEPGKN